MSASGWSRWSRVQPYLAAATTALVRGGGALIVIATYWVGAELYTTEGAAFLYAILTATAVATPILLFGMNSFLVRRLAIESDPDEMKAVTARLYRRFVAAIAALALVTVALAAGLGVTDTAGLAVLAVIAGIIPATAFLGFAMQGASSYSRSILVLNLNLFLLLIGGMIAARLAVPALPEREQIALAFSGAASIALAVAAVLWIRAVASVDPPPPGTEASGGLTITPAEFATYWAVYVLVALNNWLPQLLYFALGERAQFAPFSAAQRVANVVNLFLIIANFILAPKIARLYHEERSEELGYLYRRTAQLTTAAAVPVTLIIVVAAPTLLGLLFGDDFRSAAAVLSILAVAQLLNVSTGSSSAMLTMTGHQAVLVRCMATALAVGLVYLALIGYRFGATGFASAVALTLTVQNVLAVRAVSQELGIKLFSRP